MKTTSGRRFSLKLNNCLLVKLWPKHQSAYRRGHSTETALIKIFNDLLQAADKGHVSALSLLDLTAAFDTVDHEVLISRLERRFGLKGSCLLWFQSYLSQRTYCVVLHEG